MPLTVIKIKDALNLVYHKSRDGATRLKQFGDFIHPVSSSFLCTRANFFTCWVPSQPQISYLQMLTILFGSKDSVFGFLCKLK
jgi:hypothetical protein